MGIPYGKLELPESIKAEDESSVFCRFIAEPFERGFGHTIGNALRRMLLNSLEAPAIVSIMMEGVPHEYMAVEGVIEDMTDIVLNLKGALLRRSNPETEQGHREFRVLSKVLEVTAENLAESDGQVRVTLGDVVASSDFVVMNPDLHLFTVTKPFERRVDLKVSVGRGYRPSEKHDYKDKVVDEIYLDSCFSPVRLVNYHVENTRVGSTTDFDRLIIEVTTDGRVTPREALCFAAQIGYKHLQPFEGLEEKPLEFREEREVSDEDDEDLLSKLAKGIYEIELSVRSTNCLKQANIRHIGELVLTSEADMLKTRNFGKKSLCEIKSKLEEMGLSLGMDLTHIGVHTLEELEEKLAPILKETQV